MLLIPSPALQREEQQTLKLNMGTQRKVKQGD